jgi:hypothetical protein
MLSETSQSQKANTYDTTHDISKIVKFMFTILSIWFTSVIYIYLHGNETRLQNIFILQT